MAAYRIFGQEPMLANNKVEVILISDDEDEAGLENSDKNGGGQTSSRMTPNNTSVAADVDPIALPTPPPSSRGNSTEIRFSPAMSPDLNEPRSASLPNTPAVDQFPYPPQPQGRGDEEPSLVDGFLRHDNAGRRIINCILCDVRVSERLLLNHISQQHFWTYRPYKCAQCDFRACELDILNVVHLPESGHQYGVENYQLFHETNQSMDFVLQMVHQHSLDVHAADDEREIEAILQRVREGTRILREANRNQFNEERAETPDSTASSCATNDAAMPDPISVPTPPYGSDVDIGSDRERATPVTTDRPPAAVSAPAVLPSSTAFIHQALPNLARARKTIVRPCVPPSTATVEASPSAQLDHETPTSTNKRRRESVDAEMNNNLDDHNSESTSVQAENENVLSMESDERSVESSSPSPMLTPQINTYAFANTPPRLQPAANASGSENNENVIVTSSSSEDGASNSVTVKSLPLSLVCDFCDVIPQNMGHLKDHGIKNHAGGYVPFRCVIDGCSFGTWRPRVLRDHVSTTHGPSGHVTLVPVKPNLEQKEQLQKLLDSFMLKGIVCEEVKTLIRDLE